MLYSFRDWRFVRYPPRGVFVGEFGPRGALRLAFSVAAEPSLALVSSLVRAVVVAQVDVGPGDGDDAERLEEAELVETDLARCDLQREQRAESLLVSDRVKDRDVSEHARPIVVVELEQTRVVAERVRNAVVRLVAPHAAAVAHRDSRFFSASMKARRSAMSKRLERPIKSEGSFPVDWRSKRKRVEMPSISAARFESTS